ncbi:MarR family transcriptional regulator [Streptomyces sp. NPDC004647]|uniref:MarR family winged helix-turn-helix transcriptional regulator n=1 Tax=Streptomyces sp. NPDC004647 TaxID=3154671 RepID=UPI0033AE8B6B
MVSEVVELLEMLWEHSKEVPTAPVSTAQLRAMYLLEREDGIKLKSLADGLGATPPSASRLCDRLEAVGFLERAPSASSRRELELSLTPAGREHLGKVRALREEHLAPLVTAMPAVQQAALRDGLRALQAAAADARAASEGRGTSMRSA